MCADHNEIGLEVNNRYTPIDVQILWKVTMHFSEQHMSHSRNQEVGSHSELNENERPYENLLDAAKAEVKGIF